MSTFHEIRVKAAANRKINNNAGLDIDSPRGAWPAAVNINIVTKSGKRIFLSVDLYNSEEKELILEAKEVEMYVRQNKKIPPYYTATII